MFHSPGYNPMFLDQQIFVNWRADHLTPPKHRRRLAGQTARANAAGNTLKKRKVGQAPHLCSVMKMLRCCLNVAGVLDMANVITQ